MELSVAIVNKITVIISEGKVYLRAELLNLQVITTGLEGISMHVQYFPDFIWKHMGYTSGKIFVSTGQ